MSREESNVPMPKEAELGIAYNAYKDENLRVGHRDAPQPLQQFPCHHSALTQILETSRTEVVILQAHFSVARDVGVPVGDGLHPCVYAAVPANGRGERGTKGAEDGHRSL